MSLRLKLFLLFGSLIAALILAQWYLIRVLTKDMNTQVGEVAMTVGRNMANIFVYRDINTNEEEVLLSPEFDTTSSFVAHSGNVKNSKVIKDEENGTVTHHFTMEDGTKKKVVNSSDKDHKVIVWKTEVVEDKVINLDDPEHQKVVRGITTNTHEVSQESIERGDGVYHLDFAKSQLGNALQEDEKTKKGYAYSYEVALPDGEKVQFIDPGRFDIKLKRTHENQVLVLEGEGLLREIPVPKAEISRATTNITSMLFFGSLVILVTGLGGAGYIAHRISRPLSELADAARYLGEGNFGHTIKNTGDYPEISDAITAFNGMSLRLYELDEQARMAQRRQYLSELGEIARGLAHTIRNPLNTLGLSLEQLAAMSSDPVLGRSLMDGSQKQIRRIDQWIRSFLALASEGKGQTELLDVGGLVQDVVLEAIQDNLGKAKVNLEVGQELPKLQGVAPELRAVFQALVVNAIEASPKGGQVSVSLQKEEDDALVFAVQDEGEGLPDVVRERLFTPHVTTKAQGSGMGLFLAHRLATSRYGGSLSLTDATPKGTLAVLTLPKDNDYGTN